MNLDSNLELIDNAISIRKKYNFKTSATQFETIIDCTFENGLIVLSEINLLCSRHEYLTWLPNFLIHDLPGSEIFMEATKAIHI